MIAVVLILVVLLALSFAVLAVVENVADRRDRCPACKGKGYTVKRVNDMSYSHGGGMAGYANNRTRNKMWRDEEVKCARCTRSTI